MNHDVAEVNGSDPPMLPGSFLYEKEPGYEANVRARVIKPRAYIRCTCTRYGMSKGAGQASKTKAERERDGRETRREQARMHQQTSRARDTSQRRSVNYDNRCLA